MPPRARVGQDGVLPLKVPADWPCWKNPSKTESVGAIHNLDSNEMCNATSETDTPYLPKDRMRDGWEERSIEKAIGDVEV